MLNMNLRIYCLVLTGVLSMNSFSFAETLRATRSRNLDGNKSIADCGSYGCPPMFSECFMNETDGSSSCQCVSGAEGDDPRFSCTDIDECAKDEPCPSGGYCVDWDPPVKYICECLRPFIETEANEHGATQCQDRDECLDLTLNTCSDFATCTNTYGGYECDCLEGYDGDGFNCQLKEPEPILGPCEELEPGNFVCQDVEAYCDLTVAPPKCRCNQGYVAPAGLGGQCENRNECTEPNHNCDSRAGRSTCTDMLPPFFWSCQCNEGWIDAPLTDPGTVCIDFDECVYGSHNCNIETEVCVNRVPPARWECVAKTPAPTPSPTPAPINPVVPIVTDFGKTASCAIELAVTCFETANPSVTCNALHNSDRKLLLAPTCVKTITYSYSVKNIDSVDLSIISIMRDLDGDDLELISGNSQIAQPQSSIILTETSTVNLCGSATTRTNVVTVSANSLVRGGCTDEVTHTFTVSD